MLCLCRRVVFSLCAFYQTSLGDIYGTRPVYMLNAYIELLRLGCPIRRSWFVMLC